LAEGTILTFSLREIYLSTFFGSKESGQKEITAPPRAGTNSWRGLAKITKNDIAPKRHEWFFIPHQNFGGGQALVRWNLPTHIRYAWKN